MELTRAAVVQALHQIFDEHRVYSGGSMMLSQLEEAWQRSGLRHSDLADGLLGLTAQNEIELNYTDAGLTVKLLSYGRSQSTRSAARPGQRVAKLAEAARAGRMLAEAQRRLRLHLQTETRTDDNS